MKKVSVIIPTFNSAKHIEECMKKHMSLLKNSKMSSSPRLRIRRLLVLEGSNQKAPCCFLPKCISLLPHQK